MYNADDSRYEKMTYNRCGKSGLKLPKVSLGFWHNFGSKDIFDNMVAMGNIPKGRKEKGKKELVWYKDELQECIKRLKR